MIDDYLIEWICTFAVGIVLLVLGCVALAGLDALIDAAARLLG